MKQAAIVIIGFLPRYFVRAAGAMAPKNAPAFNNATMLEETYAECLGLIESPNSFEKLVLSVSHLCFGSAWTIPSESNDGTSHTGVVAK
jgi:hypothetical protein